MTKSKLKIITELLRGLIELHRENSYFTKAHKKNQRLTKTELHF